MNKILVTLALVTAMGATGYSQGVINRREQNQRERIQQGVKSGELTRHEARKLAVDQAHTRFAEAKARADGKITKREALRLDHRLDSSSRSIHHQKHDRQDRR